MNLPLITGYTFDDLILLPQYSRIKSRRDPDISTSIGELKLDIPIVSSPMNTVTETNMAVKMSNLGASAVVHRYMSPDEMLRKATKIVTFGCAKKVFYAIGMTGDYLKRAHHLYDTLGITNFCIDVANGHSAMCINAVEELRKLIPRANIMAGNVCTFDGAYRLADASANIIRVGIGNGSMCTTRLVTGHGFPQASAIVECLRIKEKFPNVGIVSDGGIRGSCDLVKALAVGADAVMVGGLLAGTDETPGEINEDPKGNPGRKFKFYAGMASQMGRKFNGWFAEEDASFVPEGEAIEVPYRGPVENIIQNLVGGLRVGMSYSDAMNLKELRANAQWAVVTENGKIEGTAHGKR